MVFQISVITDSFSYIGISEELIKLLLVPNQMNTEYTLVSWFILPALQAGSEKF